MKVMRTLFIPAFFVLALTVSPPCAAQDPGHGAPSPPRIQGPTGGPLAMPAAPDAGQAATGPLKFKMYALLGQKKENAQAPLEDEIKPVESALKSLPYTSYQKISIDERETPDGADTQFPINAVYSLVVHPEGNDEQGAAKLEIHVDLLQDGKLIKALTAQAAAKPGDALVLHGMPLPPGNLVIVLQRDAGDQNSQGGQSSQDQQKKDQQKQDQQQNSEQNKEDSEKKDEAKKSEQQKQDEKKDQKEAKPEENKDQDQQEQPSAADMKKDSEKKDNKNLESILESLEDVDRKEQSELHNQRDRIDFKGDWW